MPLLACKLSFWELPPAERRPLTGGHTALFRLHPSLLSAAATVPLLLPSSHAGVAARLRPGGQLLLALRPGGLPRVPRWPLLSCC
jgi:hypothetical protein